MITREEFAAQTERGAAMFAASFPVTSGILRFVTEELKKGEPAWWKKTAKCWDKRAFYSWSEAWNLFVTCLHFEALGDHEENPLAPFFPSCGGTAEADPASGLAKFLANPPDSFYENLKNRYRRYHNRVAGGAWRVVAACFFEELGLPYYLVQPNAGAGLELAVDAIHRDTPAFRADLVEARVGLDPDPLLVEDLVHRRWLAAAVFPELEDVLADLGQAVERLGDCKRKDPNFVQLVKCDPLAAPRFVAKNIPPDDDVGLLVFNVMTTARMADADCAAYSEDLWKTLRPWGKRALWFQAETVRGEMYSTTINYRVSRAIEKGWENCDFGRADFASDQAGLDLKGVQKFLISGS